MYALEQIHSLINSTQILHVSFQPPDSPFPVILPMIGQMGSLTHPSSGLGDPLDLYLHGYVSARISNLTRNSGAQGGLPLCVAASHCDGLVLALSAFSSSYNYRSAALFGHATIVEEQDERLYAMELITNSVVPGRWKGSRLPPTGSELQSTAILKVKIASGSAKIRDGSCGDEKSDMENEQVTGNIWAGVLPVYQAIGEPIPSSYNKVDVPEHVSEHVKNFSHNSKELSVKAAREKASKP